MTVNAVDSALLQLVAALEEEREQREGPEVNHVYLQLVRDAARIFERIMHQPDLGWGQDVKDWLKVAETVGK